MSKARFRTGCSAVVFALMLSAFAASSSALSATASATAKPPLTLPQAGAANKAANWLAGQVTSKGYLASAPNTPDLSTTALAPLALASTGGWQRRDQLIVSYLERHVSAYVTQNGSDGPGQLATLILDAHAVGVSPTDFGGTNLVNRLLATYQTSGTHAGLFGKQNPTYDGAYREGLSLVALSATGVTKGTAVSGAIRWLKNQQCANGSWMSYRSSLTTPCPPSNPNTYSGPDTNSTALAVQGLVAQHATSPHGSVPYFESAETGRAGWGYYGPPLDPDSTALVMQTLIALGHPVASPEFQKGSLDPVNALLSFQLSSGAFTYPVQGQPNTANVLATEQALPVLERKSLVI